MPNYINNLKKAENGRYVGFDKYLECVNKAQISKDYENVVETIKKVKAAVAKLIAQQEFASLIKKITDVKGNLKKECENSILEKIEDSVVEKKRPLNDNEVEEKVVEVAKEVTISEEEPPKKCIEDEFNIKDFMVNYNPPPITPQIRANLKKIHSEIIVPIMKYYKGNGEIKDDGSCKFTIVCGLASKADMIKYNHATNENVHPQGKAIDFYISDLDTTKVFKDICDNKIDLNYGVIFNKGASIHITIPYNKFKKFILTINSEVTPFTTALSFAGKVLGKLFN